jgi:predicted nuclease of predicted toxin-antitoxin system
MEKIKIYLDEDVRPLLAEILRDRGYDVISCVEKKIFGLSDEEQLKTAINDGRAFLTHNIKDFVQLHKKLKGKHFGIILSDQISLSVVLRRLLKFLATTSLENLKGKLIWLSNYK